MLRKTPSTMLVALACLGLAACSDKAPELQTPPAQPPSSQAAPSEPQVTVASEIGPWTGDISDVLQTELCALDSINGTGATEGRFEVPANQATVFDGWVSTSDLKRPEKFLIVLDGESDFQINGVTGVSRDDVAQAYSATALANAGYRVELPALTVPAGDYAVILVQEEGGQPVACPTKLTLLAR